jgi:hypothetical protein
MHDKLHHLHGLAYHYSLQFTGALVVGCCSLLVAAAAAVLGLAAGRLHEAEAGAAGTLEQELHHAQSSGSRSSSFLSAVSASAMIWTGLCMYLCTLTKSQSGWLATFSFLINARAS